MQNGRKIYSKVSWNINDPSEILEEESFYYVGPMSLCDGEDDDKDDDAKDDDKGGDKTGEVLAKITETLGGYGEAIAALGNEIKSLKAPAIEEEEEKKSVLDDLPDLEKMDRAGFLGIVAQVIDEKTGASSKDILAKLGNLEKTQNDTNVASQVKELAKGAKDLGEWNQEILALHKEMPNASVQRLYMLAKGENPDKAKEMDKKYAPEDDKDKDKEKKKKGFGGLHPGGGSGSDGESKKMDAGQAAESAWAQVFGDE